VPGPARARGLAERYDSGMSPAGGLRRLVAVGVLALGAGGASAQWVPVRRYTVADGLAQSQVMALTLDRAGFLWIGTQGGLSRFDGVRFRTFTIAEGLPDDVVTAMAAGPGRALWIGTDSGWVARVTPGGIQPVGTVAHGVPRPVAALVVRPDGTVLAGSAAGLLRLGPGRRAPLLETPVAALALAGERVLVGSPDAVRVYPGDRVVPLPGPPTAWAPGRGRLLAAGTGWVVAVGPDGEPRAVRTPDGVSPTAVAEARDGGMWLATGRRLWHLGRDGRPRGVQLRPGTVRARITALLEDGSGGLWAGTWGQGLLAIRPHGVWALTPDAGLPSTTVWSFAEAADGCIRLATEDAGVASWCGDRWGPRWTAADGLASDATVALLPTPDGALWVGCTGGISRIGPHGRIVTWREEDGLPHGFVRDLALAPDGTVWAATSDGIAHWDGSRWHGLGARQGIVGAPIRGIAVAADGTVWMATHAAGVLRWDGSRVERFGIARGLPHERVWCLRIDSRGRVWAGTDAGLWIHDPRGGSDRTVRVADGLPNPNVLFLVEDHRGRMWVGTTRGVAVLSPGGRVLRVVTAADGLTHSEAAENAALAASDGRLWFGMAEGVSVVDPDALLAPPEPVRPVLERVLVDGRPIPYPTDGTVVLEPGTTDVRVEVAAPAFRAPHSVRFRYRLEGLDAAWTPPTDEAHATYRRLPPGRYRLLVAAVREPTDEPTAGLSLVLVVRPPWYATVWFRLSASLLALAAVAGAIRVRLATQERRRRELEREVAQRTAELAAATERIREQNRRLEELSRTDPLTGLANRRVIEEQLPLEMALGQREFRRLEPGEAAGARGAALLLLDLDGFKAINDRLGHDAGDRVLRAVAGAVQRAVREVDVVARWGGDELLVLARAVNGGEALHLARRILDVLVELPAPDGSPLSASLGFLPYPLATRGFLPRDLWPRLIEVADRLLYLAKSRGRRRAVGVRRVGPSPADEQEVIAHLQEHPETPPEGLELVEVLPSTASPGG